jgi:uncharacterized membrane protein YoaK (UPF0700 family)
MKWSASVSQIEPPRPVAILLATVAGFVDACTFLGLFGLFVAQLTGSYVFVGTSLVMSGWPGATLVLAVPIFFAAGIAATLVATTAAANGLPALACGLLLETVLIVGFAALMVLGAPFPTLPPATAFAAALFGLSAMGVQSALVRLLLRGMASTNVMTTNTTQIAIDATQAAMSWGAAPRRRSRHGAPARGRVPPPRRRHAAAVRLLGGHGARRARLRSRRPLDAGAAGRRHRRADAVGGAGAVKGGGPTS